VEMTSLQPASCGQSILGWWLTLVHHLGLFQTTAVAEHPGTTERGWAVSGHLLFTIFRGEIRTAIWLSAWNAAPYVNERGLERGKPRLPSQIFRIPGEAPPRARYGRNLTLLHPRFGASFLGFRAHTRCGRRSLPRLGPAFPRARRVTPPVVRQAPLFRQRRAFGALRLGRPVEVDGRPSRCH